MRAFATKMDDDRKGYKNDLVTQPSGPVAEVRLLKIHEILIVETTKALEKVRSNHQ